MDRAARLGQAVLRLNHHAKGRHAMIADDDLPRPRPARLQPLLLDPLGVAELQAYIAELRAEIARAEGEIAKKGAHRSAADAFFKLG
jgi:uncharacterized small protein (DUF1192 family)